MRHVRVSVTAGGREDEIHPIYDVLANAAYVEYATAINWNFSGSSLGILHYIEGDRTKFRRVLEETSVVRGFELNAIDDDSFYAYVWDETTPALRELSQAVADASLVTAPPIEYHADGRVTFSVFGPGERIQAAIDSIPDPVAVTIEEISGLAALPQTVPAGLTERQRTAVQTGVSLGYYDVPRSASHEDVADEMGCAPSTAAEHLRKAESAILKRVIET